MLTINATMVAVVLNFIILIYVLNYFLYKPVMKLLNDRKEHVGRTLSEAAAKMSAAEAFMKEGRDAVAAANTNAGEIMGQAAAASEKMRKDALAKAKKEIEEQKERARHEIKQYKAEARKSMINETAKLSVMIAEKIIMKKMDRKSQRSIVERFLEGIKN